MDETASGLRTIVTEEDLPSKVLRLSIGHSSAHCSLPAVAVVLNPFQGHQKINAQRCRIKDNKPAWWFKTILEI